MFYDKFISLCAQKGESPTQVSKNIGLSNAAATGWKNGKKPNDITLKRLADYFGVPVDELKEPESIFYKNYLRLCNSVRKSPSAVALEIGIAKPTVSRWKDGGKPTDATALKVADYFGVPVSELTEEKEKAPTDGEHEITFDDFTYAMQNESKDLTEADKQILLSMAKQLNDARKKKNGESN